MSSMDLRHFCEAVSSLAGSASQNIETEIGFVCGGDYNSEVSDQLQVLKGFIESYSLPSIRLTIDGSEEDWENIDLSDDGIVDWSISVSDKSEVLLACSLVSRDIEALLFFSLDYFQNEWIPNASGLSTPENHHRFTTEKPLKIYVNNLSYFFGGPRIAIIPVDKCLDVLPHEWMQSTRLPNQDQIKKVLHIVSSENNIILPEKLCLNWGNLDNPIAVRFLKAFSVSLLISLCQEYFSRDKVVIKGNKRLEIPLYSTLDLEIDDTDLIKSLSKTVEWCFAENDESTRILLVVDRISLDIKDNESFYSALPYFSDALSEAKDRYKYVILDRKKDYTKELSDLHKDVSSVVDKMSSAVFSFTSALLRDVLMLSFILTAGVASRKFLNENALVSVEAGILFKAFSIYLFVAVFFRGMHTALIKWQSSSIFENWQKILRSYMSKQELQNKIDNILFPVRVHYWISFYLTLLAYFIMAILSWNMHFFLRLFGVIQ